MKKLIMIVITGLFFSACTNVEDTVNSPDLPDPGNPNLEGNNNTNRLYSFQSETLQGPMPAASATLKQVEESALIGCAGGLDCIPRIDYPELVPVSGRTGIKDNDLVLGVYQNGIARAYPLAGLFQAEIANDTLGGEFISVNFCPLTGTGLNFKGRFKNGEVATFGVSGLLYNNNLILYDHQTTSFWPQMLFTSGWGEKQGEQLHMLPIMELTWKAWKALFPTSTVMHSKYDRSDPYGDYRTNHNFILFPQAVDSRLNAKDLVYGVIGPQSAKAYPFQAMQSSDVINDIVDDEPIVILFHAESDFAIGFKRPVINNFAVEFEKVSDEFPFNISEVNGNAVWNFMGVLTEEKEGYSDLEPISTAYTGFWLSWGTYYNGIDIYEP